MKFSIEAGTPEALAHCARVIGRCLCAGDTVLLAGPVGVGKSHFARALIQDRLASLGRMEDVPSPSFTLVQTYDLDDVILWHVDLYRLHGTGEIAELGLDEAFSEAICLVEWPERLGAERPERHLRIVLAIPDLHLETRRMEISLAGDGWETVAAAVQALFASDKAGR